ncbi:zinc finger and SCAN domain-containing protein 2 isoform X1 [Oncorhynchus mykiss]|uniref:C2H2-type domain-containing protein n=2 Tax=Oncorhynchus mykiss TaxID=8022 RepID=A0A8C7LFP2_ONCMY|nr:zinc finger and SCAN domain-containing protein 2 isoform X1 [Oncorhynchus mykiss]
MANNNIIFTPFLPLKKKPDRDSEWRKLKDKSRNRINIGEAFTRWRNLKEDKSMPTDAEVALFLLDRLAAPPPQPAAPPPSPEDIIVNIDCLLQLFQRCEQCRRESVIQTQGDRTCLSVTQHCQSCNHRRTWASNASTVQTMLKGNGDQPQNIQVDMQVALPPEDTDGALLSENRDGDLPSEDRDENLDLTGSLEMRVTVDQPPRPGGSGMSLVRGKNEGNKGTEERKKVTKVVLDSEMDCARSQEDNGLSSQENEEGEERKGKFLGGEQQENEEGEERKGQFLGGEQQENGAEQRASIEVTIYSIEPEDSESPTSQIDRGEKTEVAADGCEGEGDVCEMEGEETDEEDRRTESDSEFDPEAEEEGLRESDSEFDPEEEKPTSRRGRGRGRGRGKGRSRGRQLQQPTGGTGLDESAEDSDGSPSSSPQRDQQDQESFSGAAGELGSGDLVSIRQKFKYSKKHHMVLCPECGVLYTTRLKHHKCEHKFMVRCPDCGQGCASELRLKQHRRLHRQDLKFPCKFCLQSFRTRPDKLTHEKTHRFKRLKGHRCYSCSECPLSFDNILIRNRHLREHESKRHICHTCYKEFNKGHLLERHALSHSDDKPFKCQVCQRAFAQLSQLKSHLRVHTGERPFQCQHCDKSFNHNVSLKNHIRRYHSPDSGLDPDGGTEVGGQGGRRETDGRTGQEGGEVKSRKPRQQVELTFMTEWEMWAGGEGAKRVEEKPRKRKRQCNDDPVFISAHCSKTFL